MEKIFTNIKVFFCKTVSKPRHLKNIIRLSVAYIIGFLLAFLRSVNVYIVVDPRYLLVLFPCILLNSPNISVGAMLLSTFFIAIFSVTTVLLAYSLVWMFSSISDGLLLFGFCVTIFCLGLLRAYYPKQLGSAVMVSIFLLISEIVNGHFDYLAGKLDFARPVEYIKISLLGCGISCVVNLLVFPYWAGDHVRKRFKKGTRSLACLLKTEIDIFIFLHDRNRFDESASFLKVKRMELKSGLSKAQLVFSEITNYMRDSKYEISYSCLTPGECNIIIVYIKKLLQHLVIVGGACEYLLERTSEPTEFEDELVKVLTLFLADCLNSLKYIYGCIDKKYANAYESSEDNLPSWNKGPPNSNIFSNFRRKRSIHKLMKKFPTVLVKETDSPLPFEDKKPADNIFPEDIVLSSLEEHCEILIKKSLCFERKEYHDFYFILGMISFGSRLKEFTKYVGTLSNTRKLHIPFLWNHHSYQTSGNLELTDKFDLEFIKAYLKGMYYPLNRLIPKERMDEDFVDHNISVKSLSDYHPIQNRKSVLVNFLSRFLQQFKTDHFRYAIRFCAVQTAVLSFAFSPSTSQWFEQWRVQWALVTMSVVMTPTVGESNLAGVWRIVGTIVGGIWGIITWSIFPSPNLWVGLFFMAVIICVPISIFQECTSYYRRVATVSLVAFNIVLMGKYTQAVYENEFGVPSESMLEMALKRMVSISLGSVASMIATIVILPVFARDKIRMKLAEVVHGFGLHFNLMTKCLEDGTEAGIAQLPMMKIRRLEFHIQELLVEIVELIQVAKSEVSLYEETVFPSSTYIQIHNTFQITFDRLTLGRLLWNSQILRTFQWKMSPISSDNELIKKSIFSTFYLQLCTLYSKLPYPQSISIPKSRPRKEAMIAVEVGREDLVYLIVFSILKELKAVDLNLQRLFGCLDFEIK